MSTKAAREIAPPGLDIDPEKSLYDQINEKIESLSIVKFAAYRVACKLRVLQKYLKLSFVDYNILVRAFNSLQLPFGAEIERISTEQIRNVLTSIYQLISTYHFNQSSIDETVETFIAFLREILDESSSNSFDLHSFKIIVFTLSNAKLTEKYRCFFREVATPNVVASQAKLNELFEILLKLPNHFDQVESFHFENIAACVQSCLDHTHDGIVREDIFVNWMSREPQTLVWLPTLHRLIATESVRHEAQCNTCKAYPLIGMRYRCLRCFNYDLCQRCFFTGDHGDKHDGTHPIEEYCKQVTPFEDLKAFVEFMKLKVGKNELRRKERYLSIERSKSFSEPPKSNQEKSPSKNLHHSLNRTEQKSKKEKIENSEVKTAVKSFDSTKIDEIEIKRDDFVSRTIPIRYEDEESTILLPKKQKIVSKSRKEIVQSEHYQSPFDKQNEEEEIPPPLPPKQRQIKQTSRSLVYDFIGNELQELRATLAEFDKNSTN